MTTIRTTTFCEDDTCKGHVHEYERPGKRVVLTDDPAMPLALADEEDES